MTLEDRVASLAKMSAGRCPYTLLVKDEAEAQRAHELLKGRRGAGKIGVQVGKVTYAK